MKKIFSYPFIVIALLSLTSCATSITKLNTSGPYTYKINTLGVSKDIQTETINTATNLCRTMNKDYRFIKNTILPKSLMGLDLISYDLIFSCVDPGSAQPAPPDATKSPAQESGPETTAEEAAAKEKQLAATAAASGKKKKTGITGDSPDEPESLGGPSPAREPEPEKEEGDIIEEPIVE